MHSRALFSVLTWFLVLIFIVSCSLATAAPTATLQAASTEVPTSAVTFTIEAPTSTPNAAGQCENQYYPVRPGATWSYTSSGGPTGAYHYTDSITAVRSDGFTLTSQFNNLTRTQEWAC